LDSFVCMNSLKFLDNCRSFPPNFMIFLFPLLIVALHMTGMNMASIYSPIFSIRADQPFSMHSSISLTMFLLPNLTHFRLLSFSFSLTQVIPYSYGSIMRGYLWEAVRMVPFSTETGSSGRPCWFHRAMVASSVSSLMGEMLDVMGMLFSEMYLMKY